MNKYEKGKIVNALVTGIEPYGIFVSLDDGYKGMIHISEISYSFVSDIKSFVKLGDSIFVEILEVNNVEKKLNLSIKNIDYKKSANKIRHPIIETNNGFKTLSYKLPIWISEKLKKIQKN